MRASKLSFVLVVILVIATALAIFRLEKKKTVLLQRLAVFQQQNEILVRLREENHRRQTRLQQWADEHAAATSAIHAEVEKTRHEIAALESRAEKMRAQKVARAAAQAALDETAMAYNRDPAKGLTRLEYFQNVGFATPGTAFQTLVWAAMKGDDTTLRQGFVLSDAARQRAATLLASLPENLRAESTPEQFAALWFMRSIMDVSAAQVTAETREDASHATLIVRGKIGTNQMIEMRLGDGGWHMVLPAQSIEMMQKKLENP